MKTITDRLIKLDNLIYDNGHNLKLHNEGEWSKTDSPYSAFNDAGVECEVGEFFYAMVRLMKPMNVLETGTHFGISASYMGLALQDNGTGGIDTYEFLPEIHAVANARFKRMGLDQVYSHLMDVGKLTPDKQYQLMFLDTEPQTRFDEMVRFYDHLSEGGMLFIHDLHQHMHQIEVEGHEFAWPYGKIPGMIKQLVTNGNLRPIHFHTPRGLTGFYKVSDSDYKWT